MALFSNYKDFALHTMNEYLTMAKHCIETKQEESADGCYGMAALLLLTSVMDTLGSFYPKKRFKSITQQKVNKNQTNTAKDHFKAFRVKFLLREGLDEKTFTDTFYELARCKAVHNAALACGIKIVNDQKDPLFVLANSSELTVNISRLYKCVEDSLRIWAQDAYNSSDIKSLLTEYGPITGSTIDNQSRISNT